MMHLSLFNAQHCLRDKDVIPMLQVRKQLTKIETLALNHDGLVWGFISRSFIPKPNLFVL